MKNQKIKELLERNRQLLLEADIAVEPSKNGICYDGIINEEEFEKMPVKVAFLLKETNATDETGKMPDDLKDWDYRLFIA